MTAALRLHRVAYAYGRRSILSDVDLEVARGAGVALLGPNGSGKTTLLRIAAGLRAPASGTATLGDGTPLLEASRKGRIAYIPQHLGLVRHATALENALLGSLGRTPLWRAVFGRPAKDAQEAGLRALEAVGLASHAQTLVRHLSGGERQRVAIARALVQAPDILVADELASSLDLRRARQALDLLDQLRARGCTVLASMHNAEAALQWADQVAILDGGKVSVRAADDVRLEEVRWDDAN